MNTSTLNKPPTWFWVIAVLALIWNAMGVSQYLSLAFMTDEAIAALPEAEQALHASFPWWGTAAFAFAVFGGTLGCILLLLRKKMALLMFYISLVGIVFQMICNIFVVKAIEVYGPMPIIMLGMVLVIGILLIWFTKRAIHKNWIS